MRPVARVAAAGLAMAAVPLLLTGCKTTGTAASAPTASTAAQTTGAAPTPTATTGTPPAGTATPSASGSTDNTSKAAAELEKQIIADSGLDTTNGPAPYADTQTVTYKNEFTFDAPKVWTDVRDNGSGEVVTTNYQKWEQGTAAGTIVLKKAGTPTQALSGYVRASSGFFSTCDRSEVHPYDAGTDQGVAQTFTTCGDGNDGTASVVAIQRTGDTVSYVFDSTIIDARDITAVATIVKTLNLVK